MSAVCGLYLGNTTISIALFKDGKTEVVTNDSGDRVTPAVVSHNGSEFTTGMAAKSSLTHNATNIVINNKRLLDDQLTEEEIENLLRTMPCTSAIKDGEVSYSFSQGNRTLTCSPEDITKHLFQKMYSIASNVIRSKTDLKVVISVPIHYTSSTRVKISEAAEASGFEVLQIVNEPSAAALSYNFNEKCIDTILVYRLGGVSCDATVIQLEQGLFKVLATIYKSDLGGNFFTKLLADYIAKEFMNKWKLDPQESKRSMFKLLKQAELSKNILSTKASTSVFIESLCDGVDWEQNMTRPRFESLISPHLSKYVGPIKECLSKAELSVDNITKVILCGASTKIPKLQSAVTSIFPSNVEIFSDKPDEVIAEGCARHASYLDTAWDPNCEHLSMDVPVLAESLFVCDAGSKEVYLHIPKHTPVPKVLKFQAESTNDFVIYESDVSSESNLVGKVSFPVDQVTKSFQANLTKNKIAIQTC